MVMQKYYLYRVAPVLISHDCRKHLALMYSTPRTDWELLSAGVVQGSLGSRKLM